MIVEVHMRTEREIDNVEVMVDAKELFVRKMNEIRNRTLAERDGLLSDQRRFDSTKSTLENMFTHRHQESEHKLMELRTSKGECRERLESYREELVRLMTAIRAENQQVNTLNQSEVEVLAIQQDNARVKATVNSSLQELRSGQALLSKDLASKVRAVELALARGANILDAVMTRKHERESELDSRCRDMFIQHHDVSSKIHAAANGVFTDTVHLNDLY
ncbi:hypothetical protein T484DRAFT_1812823 [Baffinella frigidus]|nr:hypothetical protein T484DRAFT_1812823 [Cryptophyta sp. CCMP2293]